MISNCRHDHRDNAKHLIPAIRSLRREIADEWLLGLGGVLSVMLGVILIVRQEFGRVTTT
jgi:hypothetical protein